jgi:hypothetical protein
MVRSVSGRAHHRNATTTTQGRTSASRCDSLHQEVAVAQAQLRDLCDFLRPNDIPSNASDRVEQTRSLRSSDQFLRLSAYRL